MCIVVGLQVTKLVEELATSDRKLELLDHLKDHRYVFLEALGVLLQRSVLVIVREVELVDIVQILSCRNIEDTKGVAQVACLFGEHDRSLRLQLQIKGLQVVDCRAPDLSLVGRRHPLQGSCSACGIDPKRSALALLGFVRGSSCPGWCCRRC